MKHTPTPEEKAKATERREAMRKLANRISKMTDAERSALAHSMPVVTIEGHLLSTFNACMVAIQCPKATVVGGFRQWLKAGRCVAKGQHSLAIWVPTTKKVEASMENEEGREMYFMLGNVFDISQTVELEAKAAA